MRFWGSLSPDWPVAGTSPRYAPTERLFSKRWGSSTVSTNVSAVSAVSGPIPSTCLNRPQQIRFWVVLLADRLQLSVVVLDALGQRADLLQDGFQGRPECLGDVFF